MTQEIEHKTTVKQAEHNIASELHEGSGKHNAAPNYQHVFAELDKLRKEDNKLYGTNGADHFQKDLKDIDKYLQKNHLPGLETDNADFAAKISSSARYANKNNDYSNVYGYLDADKAAKEQKYGKDLGDLLFEQDLQKANNYMHHHKLPDLTLEDKGNGNLAVNERAHHGRAAHEVSNSADTAAHLSSASAHHSRHHAHVGRAERALSNYLSHGGSNDSPSGAQLNGGESATSNQIMNMLINQYGLSPAGAAAVVGNMTQENGLSTATNSGGIGLCQWIGSRAKEEVGFAKQQGLSPTSLQAQVGFMMHELNRDYPSLLNNLKTTNNAQQAALAFSKQYERPGKPQNGNRMSYAQSALDHFRQNNNTALA